MLLCLVLAGASLLLDRTSSNPLQRFVLRVRLSMNAEALNKPAGTDARAQCFDIRAGESAQQVATRLKQQGFIVDEDLFTTYLAYWNLDSRLQVSRYSINPAMNIPQLAETLRDPQSSLRQLRVIEGWRIEQIAAAIDSIPAINFKGRDFLALVGSGAARIGLRQTFAQRTEIPVGQSFEGFLFPATYSFAACESAEELVSRLLNAFDANVTEAMRNDAKALGLTLYQAVTLASIIEREAIFDDERPTIASVYLNRYFNGIRVSADPSVPTTLDADPTIQYALGNTRGSWWARITVADYRGVISPYNTYLNRGFPPSPIAAPRLASLRAAIYPASTRFTFFQAECNGSGRHRFATTFEEHLANSCR